MMHTRISLAVMLAASGLAAQDGAPKLKKSLAEGLVRHCIERDGLKPPHVDSGLEIGAGQGELVLLVRRQDGTLQFEATPRGLGDHGPASVPSALAGGSEEEVDAPMGKLAQPKAASPAAPAKLSIHRSGGTVTIATGRGEDPIAGEQVDRTRLQASLKKLFASTKESSAAAQLRMDVHVDADMQDVLTCWEVARSAGFTTLMFSPLGRMRPCTDEERDLMQGLAKKFGWVARKQKPPTVFDGELLILLDGPTRFGDVVPLILQCANSGIWQIAFAGQKDKHHRFKLPTHLPFDQ